MKRAVLTLLSIGVYVALFAVGVRALPPVRVVDAPVTISREVAHPGHATLLFLGDTGLGDAGQALLQREGFDVPLRPTVDLVRGADVAIANLEMPITTHRRRFALYKQWRYASSPEAGGALAWAGLDVVQLANNHATDEDDEGLADTIAAVRAAGIEPVGAGPDERAARRGLVVTVGDARVGLLDYCERQLVWELVDDQFAHGGRPGTAALSDEALRDDIARLRPLVDLVVVSLHIGYNYEAPTESTLRWSRRAVDLGADLVVNHHPHVAHPITLYKGRPIALSLGNFVFNTPGHGELEFGEMLFVELDGTKIARLEVLPIDVQNARVGFRPRPLVGPALDAALSSLVADSAKLGATLVRVDDRAVLRLP